MFLIVLGYYQQWPSTVLLTTLETWRNQGGLLFSFIATGLAGGVFSEVFKVYFLQGGQWLLANGKEALFKFIIIGFGGMVAGLFYELQARIFGPQVDFTTVAIKVFVDQTVFTTIFSCPVPVICNYCRDHGLSWETLRTCFTMRFYIEQILPLLVMNWCFWIPMVSLIYALPTGLQFPLMLCVVTIWGMLFTSLLRRNQPVA